jgi:hypothetical protein
MDDRWNRCSGSANRPDHSRWQGSIESRRVCLGGRGDRMVNVPALRYIATSASTKAEPTVIYKTYRFRRRGYGGPFSIACQFRTYDQKCKLFSLIVEEAVYGQPLESMLGMANRSITCVGKAALKAVGHGDKMAVNAVLSLRYSTTPASAKVDPTVIYKTHGFWRRGMGVHFLLLVATGLTIPNVNFFHL